jgi:hypothetical protein
LFLGLRWLDTALDFASALFLAPPFLSPTAAQRHAGFFLDCGGLTPLWIFPSTCLTPSKAPSSRSTPRDPHCHKTSWITTELYPQPSAPSRLRVRLRIFLLGLRWLDTALDFASTSFPAPPFLSQTAAQRHAGFFLDCGGLTPLWIFPSSRSIPIQSSVKPEHSKTPSFQQTSWVTAELYPQPSAPSRLRVRLRIFLLGLRWLDTALDFPIDVLDTIQSSVKPEHSKTSRLDAEPL